MEKKGDHRDSSFNPYNMVFLFISTIFLVLVVSYDIYSVQANNVEDYRGVSYCLKCHPAEVVEWAGSPHSNAMTNPNFQSQWKEMGSPKDCLSCHTTGYDENTDNYVFPEVTCEECHGPGDTMNRDISVELCARCHSGPYPTYEEWIDSGPEHGNADCLMCHDKHTSKLTFETSTGTCGQCHDTHVNQMLGTAHEDKGVECADCHMIQTQADFIRGIPAKTGHSFSLSEHELDCSSCHDRPLSKHDVLGVKAYACLSCHGDIHELRLELVNRTVYPLNNSVPLCAQCHNERYTDWKVGTHGAYDDPKAQCAKCHDPHNPIINNIITVASIPQREEAKPAPVITIIIAVVVVEILAFSIYILRRGSNV